MPEFNEARALECLSFNQKVHEWLSKHQSVKFAVLSSVVHPYVEGTIFYQDHLIRAPRIEFVVQQFENTLAWLAEMGIKPVIFAPPPRDGKNIGSCLVRSKWLGLDSSVCDISVSEYHKSEEKVISFMEEISKRYTVIWPSDELCSKLSCRSQVGDVFIYRDGGHLSHEGSRYLGKVMGFYALIKDHS